MTIDERIQALVERHEALTMNLELMSHQNEAHSKQIQEHTKQLDLDGEHIRAHVRLAELHDRRLTLLEGGEEPS